MPVSVEDLADVMGGSTEKKTTTTKQVATQKSTTQKVAGQQHETVDDLADIMGGNPSKKKFSSENTTTDISENQSTVNKESTTQPVVEETIDYSFKPNQFLENTPTLTTEQKVAQEVDNSTKKILNNQRLRQQSITEYNDKFNRSVPAEVLNDAQQSADFLQQLKEGRAVDFKNQFEARKKEAESKAEYPKANYNFGIENAFDPNSYQQKSTAAIPVLEQHVINKTIEESKTNGDTKDKVITKIYKRINPKGYAETVKASIPEIPLNSIQGLGELKDMVMGTQEKDDLLNSGKGEAELAYNNGLQDLGNEKITQGVTTNNPELINQGKQYLADAKDNWDIIKNYPSLGKQIIASEVAQEIARNNAQLSGQDEGNDAGSLKQELFGASLQNIRDTDVMKKYLADPKTKDIAEQLLKQPELVSDASYVGGFVSAVRKPFIDLGLSVGDITGFRNQADIIADKRSDELYPEETPGIKGYISHIRGAVNTTGNLLGMIAISAATEGIAGASGVGASAAQKLGAYTSFGIPSFDQNLKDSYNFIENDGARTLYATMGAMINAEGGKLLDLGKISRIPTLQNSLKEIADKVSDKTITKELTNELLEKGKNDYVDAAMKYGVNVTKGAATMSYFTFTNGVNKMLFGDETAPDELLKQTGTAFLDGMLGMSVLGAFGAYADIKREKNTSYKQFIYNMAENHDAAMDVLKLGLKDGTYTQAEYNQKVQIVNTAKAANEALKQTEQDDSVKLDPLQKAVYVSNRTAEGVINKQLENKSITETQEKKYEEQLSRLKQQREDTQNGLKFSPTLEPLYDLFNAEKEYNQALEEIKDGIISEDQFLQKKDTYQELQYKYFEQNDFATQKGENLQDIKVNRETKEAQSDKNILQTFDNIKKVIPEEGLTETEGVINRVNNAEEVNEKELEKAQDNLYTAWDNAPEARHLIEPLIQKLQNYEFATKTETRTVTENIPVEGAGKSKREIKPALEQSIGTESEITTADGRTNKGTLKVDAGNYVLELPEGEKVVIGEKAITDRDLKLPPEEKVPEPISFDEDGNVKAVTFETKDGSLVTITNPEKALDLAIQLRAEAIGEKSDAEFQQAYETVVKEIPIEVLKKDLSTENKSKSEPSTKEESKVTEDISSQSKTNNNGNNEKNGEIGSEGNKVELNAKGSSDQSESSRKDGNKEKGNDVIPPAPPQGKEKAPVDEGDKFKDKGILNRIFNAENVPEFAKEKFKEEGLTYEPQTREEADKIGKAMVDEYGIDNAVTLAETNKFKGGVNSAIFAESLNRVFKEEQDATTLEGKLDAAKRFAEIGIRYDNFAREKGRDISQISHFYKKSPLGIKIMEETMRREAFTEFAKKKNQSWKEFFDEMVKEPAFEKIFKENVREELKKERAESRKVRKEKVDDIFNKAKDQFKGGAAYSTIIPPKLITGAIDGMKKAYHAGEKVAELVQNAIDYISSELGTSWDSEKFRKEWEEKLNKGEKESKKSPAELSEEKRQKLLDRFRNKLKGLSEKEKDEVIRKSFKKLVENGALEYEDFKKIISDTLGYGELTPEQSKKIIELVTDINSVDELATKVRDSDRNSDALKKYQEAKKKAEKSATELGKIVFNRPDILKRLLSIMQLNTLGIPSLVNNPIFNVVNQATVRLPRSIIMTAIDYATYGIGKALGKDIKPENDVVRAQTEFYTKLAQGSKQSLEQFATGLTNKDYFQKEVYALQIHPLTSMKELYNWGKGDLKLTPAQVVDKGLQSTVGIPAEIIARTLNIGDKPQRYAAEGAQAATFARNLGLKGIDYKLFMEFPKEEAYRKFKKDGLSDEAAMKKAEEIQDRIIKEGEESTFQQDNMLNDIISKAFEATKGYGKTAYGLAMAAKTLNMPFIKIPLNAFWSVYNLANPEIALLQSVYYGAKAFKTKSSLDLQQSKKWFAHAVTGMAWMGVTGALSNAGIINSPNPDDTTKKEREGENYYEQQNSVNMSKLFAYMQGKDPSKVRNGLNVDLKWLGNMGILMGYQAQKLQDMTPEQKEKGMTMMEDMIYNLKNSSVDFMDKGVFSNTGAMVTAISKGGSFLDNYLINLMNMGTNIVQPAAYAQISRAQLPYYSKAKADNFIGKVENNLLTRSSTLRKITGEMPPAKIGLWGDKLEKKDNTLMRLFGISRSNDDNFAQPIYEDYKKTNNTKFFPSSVKPEVRGNGVTVKLNTKDADQLETLIGQNIKALVAPYINDMATFEGSDKVYSQLSEEEKIDKLNILYEQGFKNGKVQFLTIHPEIEKQLTPSEAQIEAKKQKEQENKSLREATKSSQ